MVADDRRVTMEQTRRGAMGSCLHSDDVERVWTEDSGKQVLGWYYWLHGSDCGGLQRVVMNDAVSKAG